MKDVTGGPAKMKTVKVRTHFKIAKMDTNAQTARTYLTYRTQGFKNQYEMGEPPRLLHKKKTTHNYRWSVARRLFC